MSLCSPSDIISTMSGCISRSYRHDLDLLKGFAIIAVMLYHAGWCKSGYLGVDVFFVLNGYFIVPQVMRQIEERRFRYFAFLEKKIFRLLPLVLLISCFALAIGYWGMLPGDYRFLSEEVIASSLFGNNILQAFTTQNYWAAIYHKILMHTWFLGVLMQFYVLFPLVMLLLRRWMKSSLVVLICLSLLLYLLPIDTIGDKYYMLPYRFFEIALGGMVAIAPCKSKATLSYVSFICLLLIIFIGAFTIGERAMPYNLVGGTNTIRESFMPREVLLLLTVVFVVGYLFTSNHENQFTLSSKRSKVLAPLGRMSLSVFLWHQPLFAFYRYFFEDELSPFVFVSLVIVALLLSITTYYIIERRITIHKVSRLCLLLSFLIVNSFTLWIYQRNGVVRDVPELDIYEGQSDPTAFERYTDRIYQYDKDFSSDSTKKKVLVIGNSFARDFANILLESQIADSIELSYHYAFVDCPQSRIRQCDRIYFFGWKQDVPSEVWHNLKSNTEICGIGTKNHGTSNGIFYKNRHRIDYFSQRTIIRQDFHSVNRLLYEEWQGHYVDLINLTLQPNNTVPVFTSDCHYITYDGMHLTPAGTRYYSHLWYNYQQKKQKDL